MSSRREPQPDGTVLVWRPRTVCLYAADGTLLESRRLTPAEVVDYEAWRELQPGEAERVRAIRAARAEAIAAREALAAELNNARTLPALILALRKRT